MTSHELARKLLEGPDLPIFVPHDWDSTGDYQEPSITEGYFRIINHHFTHASASVTFEGVEPKTGNIKGIAL